MLNATDILCAQCCVSAIINRPTQGSLKRLDCEHILPQQVNSDFFATDNQFSPAHEKIDRNDMSSLSQMSNVVLLCQAINVVSF